jgi:hypothetical protein
MTKRPVSAIGFTVKSGWAAAILLDGLLASPRVVDSRRIDLSDPAIPESRQPYHAGFGTARGAGKELSRLVRGAQLFGRRAVGGLIRQYQAGGYVLVGVGLVVGSLADPDTIANAHIRIHALEGQLFRRIVEDAATAHGLPCSIWRARDVYGVAARALKQNELSIRNTVQMLGKTVTGPWRTEQKAAALAAWLTLATPKRGLFRLGSLRQ